MKPNWKLFLGILLALAVTGCASPSTAASPKIYFNLERDPIALVNELGVGIIVDERSACYEIGDETANVSGWTPVFLLSVIGQGPQVLSKGDTDIQSGSSVSATGACRRKVDMQRHDLMNAWLYRRSDKPNQRFAIYSDNVDPAAASLHLPVATSALASSPFQVRFQNTSSVTISVPLNCLVTDGRYLLGDLALTHLERQTSEGWEVFRMDLGHCSDKTGERWLGDEWLDIAPHMSGSVDLQGAYPAGFTLEKGRYRWVTTFCAEFPYNRHCYTSFSPTFEYPPEQAQ